MSSSQAAINSSSTKSSKYHPTHSSNLNNPHNPHLNNMYASQELNLHRRRSSVSAANYEQFMANQQRERERELLLQQQHKLNMTAHNCHNLSLEFKQPPTNIESHLQQRSSSREMVMEELAVPVRSSSANSDSALQYYPPTRDRLMSVERSSSRTRQGI
ncbi:hypothetical protein EVAR_69649_1 [Eumeta japonica]|uniref:Uncharacterized protein n=1 Tax=Eumeta variegata TaxID=151549 RepID=A0A4C2AG99_EUMVA|nr:hypothetical protein EVAR_69649_1 [Eumeta japonica]